MQYMSPAREEAISEAVSTAAREHMGGLSANEAVTKQAEAIDANKYEVRLMTESFNTAKHLAHHQDSDPEKRAEVFELADADVICDTLFPKINEPKTASVAPKCLFDSFGDYYGLSTSHTKAASEGIFKVAYEAPQRYHVIGKAFARVDKLMEDSQREATQACRHYKAAKDAVTALVDHFSAPETVTEWPKFAAEVLTLHDEEGLAVLSAVMQNGLERPLKLHKVANYTVKVATVIDDRTEQHKAIRTILDETEKAAQAEVHSAGLETVYHLTRRDTLGVPLPAKLAASLTEGLEKAFLPQSPSPSGEPRRAEPDIKLDNEIKHVRLQMAIQDMLQDEVIKSHPPGKVVEAVTELYRVSPELARIPMALASAVRRRLELQYIEPHELAQYREFSRPLVSQKVQQ